MASQQKSEATGAIDRAFSLNIAAMVLIVLIYGASIVVGVRNMYGNIVTDAVETVQRWYSAGIGDRDEVQRLLLGKPLTPAEWRELNIADHVGNLYSFEIYTPEGFLSRSTRGVVILDAPDFRDKQALVHRAVATGEIQTRVIHVDEDTQRARALGGLLDRAAATKADHGHGIVFIEVYKPVPIEGGNTAVVMALVDVTELEALGHVKLNHLIILATGLALLALVFTIATATMLRRQRLYDRRIDRLAHYDTLTGVPNRTQFSRLAPPILSACAARGEKVAVYMVDLDRFKSVNDSLGHADGDVLLTLVANRIVSAAPGMLVARLGGDEFAILHSFLHSEAAAFNQAQAIVEAVRTIDGVADVPVSVSVSVGYAIGEGAIPLSDLLRQADAALYAAKKAGRDQAILFEDGMDETIRQRTALRYLLREALRKQGFELFFQPLHRSDDGALTSFEALLRLPDTKGGYVAPEAFIAVAEEMAIIADIGAWVLTEACRIATDWPEHISVSVNISPQEFDTGDIVARVADALRTSGLSPGRLEVEITETLFINDTDEVSDKLHRLREMGVRVVMDDFGTGYSSLKNLWKFPFDKLKVDRSCFMSLGESESVPVILRTIRAMTDAMKLRVTAEGIETETQRAFAESAGYDEMQGYLYSRPIPRDRIADYVRSVSGRTDVRRPSGGGEAATSPAAGHDNVTELRPPTRPPCSSVPRQLLG